MSNSPTTCSLLKSQVHIHEALYSQSIYSLGKNSPRNPRSISRILNSLHDNNLQTIQDLMNLSLDDLSKMRNFGSAGQSILLELLENFNYKELTNR